MFSNRRVITACSPAMEAAAWEAVIVNRDVVLSVETLVEAQFNRHAIPVCSHVMPDADLAIAHVRRCALVFVEVVPLDLLVLSILLEVAQISACNSAQQRAATRLCARTHVRQYAEHSAKP
ncbi:hypothetical protein TELCIR_10023 [Teladorsagia circumcincta]|uniref:Uncharacterized protein n=1 Tax=Teladorsagia circumcincta TaxID=45464 RepID=A0A2G9UEP0_TELCI|nr:hypothetical protein TELCIR_10023 [Teladorsagia circumcincta]